MSENISCSDCGYIYNDEEIKKGKFICPKCKSERHKVCLEYFEDLGMNLSDILKGKEIDKSLPSKKKTRKEFISGSEKRKSDGKMMEIYRNIDKDNDVYEEIVIDSTTKEVVHNCKEALSKHIGHGSDKKKKK